MKILLVNHLLDPVSGGGTAERTFQLARFLAVAGAKCTVLTLDIGIGHDVKASSRGGVRIVAVPCLNRRFFIPVMRRGMIDALVADADVVHLSGHWTILNALTFRACLRHDKPFLFCPAGALKPFGRSRFLKWCYDAFAGRKLARSAAACIAITESEKSDFSECGVLPARVFVIPNGIDPDEYLLEDAQGAVARFRRASSVGESRFLLFLGRLNSIKGPDLLLEAFSRIAARVPDVHLVLAGPDDGMRAMLETSVSSLQLCGRVHFPGYIGGADKVAALHAAAILVIPSRREAMSIVVLEGGICGCPAVFTDACGLDAIADEGAGVMVPVSVEAIASALEGLLQDEAELQRSGELLRRIVQRHYLWQSQAEQLLALAAQVATNTSKKPCAGSGAV